jgi:glycosyltransferase involved in cell wall biosynthesis
LVVGWLRVSQWWYDTLRTVAEAGAARRAAGRAQVQNWFKRTLQDARAGDWLALAGLAGCALVVPCILALAWVGFAVGLVLWTLLCILGFPALVLDRFVRRLTAVCHDPVQNAAAANCDVWIIPWINLDVPLPKPSILLIHDLVHEHFPDVFPEAKEQAHLKVVAPRRAREATLCACMSAFIRDTDLLGVLKLPASKVRLLPLAMPQPPPQPSPEAGEGDIGSRLRRPYLLYPAGFRSYKNHRILIEALHHLDRHHGERGLDLVFTGYADLPIELDTLAQELGVRDRIHVLNTVDRTTLGTLYRHALATLTPSLYEQGSFPIFEALHHGCPVAAARIPSFVEQCRGMGDAMIWFNPHDAANVASAIRLIQADPTGVRERQAQASTELRRRTWADVARVWLPVLQEAMDISSGCSTLSSGVPPWRMSA